MSQALTWQATARGDYVIDVVIGGLGASANSSLIPTIDKRHQEAGVSDAIHPHENPLRRDRFFGPRMVPARRMND